LGGIFAGQFWLAPCLSTAITINFGGRINGSWGAKGGAQRDPYYQ